jgi:hypothetical protein
MEQRRPVHRAATPLRLAAGVLVLVLGIFVSSCADNGGYSPDIPAKYQDPETGAARLMADSTPRLDGIVDVTRRFPDARGEVVGAAVLIDRAIGTRLPRDDLRGRPVFVVYVDKHAAARAVDGRKPSRFLRNGSRVVYLPAGFPKRAIAAYDRGLGVALQ